MKKIFLCLIVGFLFLVSVPPAFSSSVKAIRAKAFVLLDADSSILFSRNASKKLPPASTVKLMTAMVALDVLDPDSVIEVSRHAARTRWSRPRLRAGYALCVSDLLHLALMKSTNSAAVALAEAAAGNEDDFVELMNRKARKIGANDTHFENSSGLPSRHPQYTTALDLTIILKHALTYPLIREIIGKKQTVITMAAGRELTIGNTDALLWYRDDMVGGKTGFTRRARHCFVGALETDKGLFYAAVLGAPSRNRLWKSTSMLVDLTAGLELMPAVMSVEEKPAAKPVRRRRSKNRKKQK